MPAPALVLTDSTASPPASPAASSARRDGVRRDLAQLSVLVAEDEPDWRLVLQRMLARVGIPGAVLVATAEEALAALARQPFDVLLADLRLGSESGIRLIENARTVSPQTRAILMSAYASARDAEEAGTQGALAVLSKPFGPGQLELALRRAAAAADGLWGQVHDLSLIDMLQMYHYGRRSVALSISGEHRGHIEMRDGQLVAAEAGGLTGLAALRRLLPVKAGVVRTEALSPGAPPATLGDFTSVLLDCLRLIDEEGRAAAGTAPEAGERKLERAFADPAHPEPRASFLSERSEDGLDRPIAYRNRKGDIYMGTEKQLQDALARIQGEIGGFIGASVVDLDTGMTLAVQSARGDFDLSIASAYNSEMVKMKLKTIKALNIKSNLEDMLLTLGDQIHLIKLIGSSTFLYLAAERASTNLAIVRSVVSRHTTELL